MSYKVICAWCGRHISGDENAEEISHGICEKCHEEMMKLLETEKENSK